MKSSARKRKESSLSGEDLWTWAERRDTSPPQTVREDPPRPATWYRGVLQKISGQAS
jgi:hypothetical protein